MKNFDNKRIIYLPIKFYDDKNNFAFEKTVQIEINLPLSKKEIKYKFKSQFEKIMNEQFHFSKVN